MTPGPVEEAVAAARGGGLVVFPTDTVYGLGARPDAPGATAKIFEAKGRPRDLSLPVLVATAAAARRIGAFDERAERLAAATWPGPVTIVVPRAAESRAWDLGEAADSIALRIPAHPLALAILAGTGPLAATSANRTGEPPASACAELELLFADHADVIVCEDERPPGRASTVVDLTGDETRVIRVGEVDEERLRRFISGEHPLLDSGPFQR